MNNNEPIWSVTEVNAAVRELVENSLDAGASCVTVEIRDGGISYLRVTDNGKGMAREDVPLSILRHGKAQFPAFLAMGDALRCIEERLHIGVAVGIPDTGDDLLRILPPGGTKGQLQRGVIPFLIENHKVFLI